MTTEAISPELAAQIQDFIERALAEDVGGRDHTSQACIPADDRSTARLLVKDPGILAGVAIAERVFKHVDPTSTMKIYLRDGQYMSYGEIAFEVSCNTRALLMAERVVLNTMQRMSGIATLSNRFKFEIEDLPVKILDTRKTTPNLRFIEKWAVRLGGCHNYRDGLYDRIMIKDNHIDACGSIEGAIEQVHAYLKKNNLDLPITIEVRNLVELYEVLTVGGVHRIMLDNFELPIMAEAVATINNKYETEASGGVNIHTVRKIAQTGVNYISVGALTHSASSLDLSLKIVKD
ncbi:MAG: carboxylating nicotinate-nucleotide diphosphorylase [Saprospiraceae bacterium]